MSKKKFFLLLILFFFSINSEASQLKNNVIVSIDNSIITELDINKEINFFKFIIWYFYIYSDTYCISNNDNIIFYFYI